MHIATYHGLLEVRAANTILVCDFTIILRCDSDVTHVTLWLCILGMYKSKFIFHIIISKINQVFQLCSRNDFCLIDFNCAMLNDISYSNAWQNKVKIKTEMKLSPTTKTYINKSIYKSNFNFNVWSIFIFHNWYTEQQKNNDEQGKFEIRLLFPH